ncbi:AAHS family 4-hydroxybenzoate transporter-like MFS transporter [Trinickia symbiotica]|uniref:MFS transporter n=1 Tax=Trinickia symbiotica TaxID=863227 RepID=A0A2N7X6W2_9BURK|nr:MFS transporter [Trinickia symbiotica]PMS37321.1 MFS transporter [Trinickia symbiotica]PPK42881.1 AAHS family 4-hydroxybenzoate transporter-like MFS transporter [Trinickia symbiotica]
MSSAPPPIDVRAWLDERPFSLFQWRVLLLCFCIVAVDGFDTACVGFIAPLLMRDWHIGPNVLGMLFGAGLGGLMVGALLLGPVADRIGRKKTLIATVAFFGLASLATAHSPSVAILIALRFATGLGLGAAMPNAIALTSEYCPERRRAFLTTVMFCGFTMGSGLGGVVAAELIPDYGWRGVFLFGGIAPLALAAALAVWLPESVRYLVVKGADASKIAALLHRIAPLRADVDTRFTLHETRTVGSPVKQLFEPAFRTGTLLLWCVFFMSLLIVYLMTNWLPTLVHASGLSLAAASRIGVFYQVGGTLGALVLGRLMDRFSATGVLGLSYAFGAVFLALTGCVPGDLLAVTVAGVGFCISGSQIGANAFAARYYPTANRVTGLSWALGVGRLGSVCGALVGGALLAAHIRFPVLFLIVAVPAGIAAAAIYLCGVQARRRAALPALAASAGIDTA